MYSFAKRFFLAAGITLAALTVFPAPAAHAIVASFVSAEGSDFFTNDSDTVLVFDNTFITTFASSDEYNAAAFAQSDYGINIVGVTTSVDDIPTLEAIAKASAGSAWSDTLTINEAGKFGTNGTVRYRFNFDGTVSGSATVSYLVKHDTTDLILTDLDGAGTGTVFESQDIAFVYGTAFGLEVRLDVLSTDTGTADYFNTLELTAIIPANVNGATLSAGESGTAFQPLFQGTTVVVPEAGSLALILPALGVLGVVIVRRRK